jgi:hypothetical protein
MHIKIEFNELNNILNNLVETHKQIQQFEKTVKMVCDDIKALFFILVIGQ